MQGTLKAFARNRTAVPPVPAYLYWATLLVFCGPMGKSAQVPLHVWLPDAMEGPTPGVRAHPRGDDGGGGRVPARADHLPRGAGARRGEVIGWIGIITSVLAALMATQQSDIKRVLAYSTLSQLGYMICASGLLGGRGGDVPPVHARVLQGAVVPRRGCDHPRAAPRAEHVEDGRSAHEDARSLLDVSDRHARVDGLPGFQRIFQQGRDPRGDGTETAGDLRARTVHGVPDGVLHGAPVHRRVPQPADDEGGGPRARGPGGHVAGRC